MISIIIPVYNVEPYIADCLQSVIRQTYLGPIECIIVDDCGTDKSIQIAERIIDDYNGPIIFTIIHHKNNRGLSVARNTGIYASKGDYLFFLDSDDWISDDCINQLVQPLVNYPADIVVSDYRIIGEHQDKLALSLNEGYYQEKGITTTFCNRGIYVMAVNKLYRKSFIIDNRLFFEEGRVFEDEILAFNLSCIDKTFYVIKSETYFYRIREQSITNNDNALFRLNGYLGVLQTIEKDVYRYNNIYGIYDFYMFWIKRVFGWISKNNFYGSFSRHIDKITDGFLNVIPSVRSLSNKHNRLIFFKCKNEQTYSHYQYIVKEYANTLQGRIWRNILCLIPIKR